MMTKIFSFYGVFIVQYFIKILSGSRHIKLHFKSIRIFRLSKAKVKSENRNPNEKAEKEVKSN